MFRPRNGGGQAKTSSDLNSPVDFCFILELAMSEISAMKFSLHGGSEWGVSEAGDRCRNPEPRVRGVEGPPVIWHREGACSPMPFLADA